jgi:nicotinamidase-related amidase
MQMPADIALIIVDVQQAIDDPAWSKEGPRNNPDAERNIARLLERWRRSGRPIFHVRHDSIKPVSPYRPDQPGNAFKPEARPAAGEPIIVKTTNNAFIRTDLEQRLRKAGIASLAIAGVITNNSVEATVRMAGNLGFNTYLVEDATFTFARRDYRGILRSAEDVHAMSLANMNGEYCKVVTTEELLSASS